MLHVLSKNEPGDGLLKMMAFCREIARIKSQLGRRGVSRHGAPVFTDGERKIREGG